MRFWRGALGRGGVNVGLGGGSWECWCLRLILGCLTPFSCL